MFCDCICRWHDAGTYDAKTKTGGPNASIRNQAELNHAANAGLNIAIQLCGSSLISVSSFIFSQCQTLLI